LQVFALGVIADLVAANREVTQRALERVRRIELQLGVPPTHYQPGMGPGTTPPAPPPPAPPAGEPGGEPGVEPPAGGDAYASSHARAR
jgi:hypothetical protein